MSTDARIDLKLDGERIRWTPAGFHGFTPRGRKLAADLGRMVRPEDRSGKEPSLTLWVVAELERIDLPELDVERVRRPPDDGAVPAGAEG
jgi:hypothetical protein